MPEQDAKFLKILVRQIANDAQVDGVLDETLGVLSETKRREPLCNASHNPVQGACLAL